MYKTWDFCTFWGRGGSSRNSTTENISCFETLKGGITFLTQLEHIFKDNKISFNVKMKKLIHFTHSSDCVFAAAPSCSP